MTTHPERRLAQTLANYRNISNSSYDPIFSAEVDALVPPQRNDAGPRKQMILDFIQQNGRQPSKTSQDPMESKLAASLTTYTAPTHHCFDPEFCEKIGWVRRVDRRAARKAEIIAWIEQHGRRPQPRQADEKGLRTMLDKYAMADVVFAAEVERLCPLDTKKSHRRETK